MSRGWELYEKVREQMDGYALLEALVRALSDDELYENMKFIVRCYEIEIEEDDEVC